MINTVHILAINTGHEPHALRSVLECWGIDVTVTWVGNANQVVDYLANEPKQDLIIISGHGNADSLFLPELAPEIAADYAYQNHISADDFRQFLKLTNQIILNLSCEGGSSLLAQAFLEKGASVYIGATEAIDGSAALMYAVQWLYEVIISNKPLLEAHHLASNHSDDRRYFVLHQTPI